jgi:hypothetical protein
MDIVNILKIAEFAGVAVLIVGLKLGAIVLVVWLVLRHQRRELLRELTAIVEQLRTRPPA